jgi:transcriptional regulator of NAD metabolism
MGGKGRGEAGIVPPCLDEASVVRHARVDRDRSSGSEDHMRREALERLLREADRPVPGTELARLLEVSRQAIVHHVAVLRAEGAPIVATPRGYIWLRTQGLQDVFMVNHRPDETRTELYALVDAGLTVVDVLVEHPLYGELRGALNLHARSDVDQFLDRLDTVGASLLSTLTGGVHWHTVAARDAVSLERGKRALRRLGFWRDPGATSPPASP